MSVFSSLLPSGNAQDLDSSIIRRASSCSTDSTLSGNCTASSPLHVVNGCPATPNFTYTAPDPNVNVSQGEFTAGTAPTISTMSASGWNSWPSITTPSPLSAGQWWNNGGNFYYSPDGTKVLTVLSSTFTASGSPGGIPGNVQYDNAGNFGGATLFNILTSSIVINETFQSTGTTIIGTDSGNCGALISFGIAGNRCSNAGNNNTNTLMLLHGNNGATVFGITDQSISAENNIGVDNTGAFMGPNLSGMNVELRYGANFQGLRINSSGVTTVGHALVQDAGSNATLYIQYPSTAAVGGTLFSNVSSTNTIADTNEKVLYTNILAAGIFKNNGDCVVLTCGGHGAGNANTKRLRIRFATTTTSSLDGSVIDDTGAQAANGTMLTTQAMVCKTTSNAQTLVNAIAQGAGVLGGALANPSLTATDTAAINVSCTCQNGSATSGDCVGNAFQGVYAPAP